MDLDSLNFDFLKSDEVIKPLDITEIAYLTQQKKFLLHDNWTNTVIPIILWYEAPIKLSPHELGKLYWTLSNGSTIQHKLSEVTDVFRGLSYKWMCDKPKSNDCFTLLLKDGKSLNLQAPDLLTKYYWLQGLKKIFKLGGVNVTETKAFEPIYKAEEESDTLLSC